MASDNGEYNGFPDLNPMNTLGLDNNLEVPSQAALRQHWCRASAHVTEKNRVSGSEELFAQAQGVPTEEQVNQAYRYLNTHVGGWRITRQWLREPTTNAPTNTWNPFAPVGDPAALRPIPLACVTPQRLERAKQNLPIRDGLPAALRERALAVPAQSTFSGPTSTSPHHRRLHSNPPCNSFERAKPAYTVSSDGSEDDAIPNQVQQTFRNDRKLETKVEVRGAVNYSGDRPLIDNGRTA